MKNIIYDIKNKSNTWDGDMVGRRWLMGKEELRCVDCEGLTGNTYRKNKKEKIMIGPKGINIESEDESIKIGYEGIHIESPDESIKIGSEGIHIEDSDDSIKISKDGIRKSTKLVK